MTPEQQQQQAVGLAMEALKLQRNTALDQVADLQVELSLARHEIGQLKAQLPKKRKAAA